MNNSLFMGTPHENLQLISHVENAEYRTSRLLDRYFREMYENFRRVNGHIYSEADLEKLNLEKRPAFVYNLFRPILLQLAGNFKTNMGKIEALPRTPGDVQLTNILNDLLDYVFITANDVEAEMIKSYINAVIGRVGWIYGDWRYDLDPEGMYWIEAYDPFRIIWDVSQPTHNTKKWSYIIDRGFYTVEEIRNYYADDNPDMWDEITEKAKLMLGESEIRSKQILSMIERVFGMEVLYQGKESGYDAYSLAFSGIQYGETQYFDTASGKFKVIDFHERRSEQIYTAFLPISGEEYDITQHVESLIEKRYRGKLSREKKASDYRDAAAEVRARMIAGGLGDVKIQKKIITQIYQTSVCPALNMVLYDEPYTVQNGNFKLVPVFCFEMGQEIYEWKSYVDDLIDVIRAYTLNMNTMQTYLMKAVHSETWIEEDALGEYEEAFTQNKIGAVKKTKRGAVSGGKIKLIQPAALPPGHMQMSLFQKEAIKEISGVRDNALGTRENANESGRLFQQRIAQTDLLQIIPQDQAIGQMKLLGENAADNLFYYLTPGRVIRIIRDETNPYWIQINEDSIEKLFVSNTGQIQSGEVIYGKISESKFDIIISEVPYGQTAKEKEHMERLSLAELALRMNRPDYIPFQYFVKRSSLREKDEWLTYLKSAEQTQAGTMQQATQQAMEEKRLSNMEKLADVQRKMVEVEKGKREIMADQAVESILGKIIMGE